LFAVSSAAGVGADDVINCSVYLTDMSDFQAMNEVYAQQFRPPYPSRTTIGVASLPLGARIEIGLIAKRGR
jgi:2-iminobutanoate/2-iminopropanoate deaminase